jgi:hypothetical protein
MFTRGGALVGMGRDWGRILGRYYREVKGMVSFPYNLFSLLFFPVSSHHFYPFLSSFLSIFFSQYTCFLDVLCVCLTTLSLPIREE